MTLEEKIKEMLFERGLFEDQAKEIFDMMREDKANESMQDRWRDDIAGYPEPLLAVLWMSAKLTAVQWIDDNCPQAWYRPLFASA